MVDPRTHDWKGRVLSVMIVITHVESSGSHGMVVMMVTGKIRTSSARDPIRVSRGTGDGDNRVLTRRSSGFSIEWTWTIVVTGTYGGTFGFLSVSTEW